MEKLDGFPLSDQQRLAASDIDLSELAQVGANMYLDMIFRDGFYHADPHPGNLFLLEDTSRRLNPDFSLAELLQPYYAQALKRRLSPHRLIRRLQRTYRDWEHLIDMFPREVADLLERVRRGSFEVNLHHRRLDATINRLVLGVLTAALFMGSAMLWSRSAPPLVLGISLFGALGCFAAIVMGLRLLWAIQKSGKIESDE